MIIVTLFLEIKIFKNLKYSALRNLNNLKMFRSILINIKMHTWKYLVKSRSFDETTLEYYQWLYLR